MSKNSIAIIPQFNLPANMSAEFAAFTGADDLDQGVSAGFPVMSLRGAKWRIVEGGEEHPIYMDGTKDLAPSVKVIIMRANAALSKTYYAGQYVEGSDSPPDCSSNDSTVPAADSPKPQAASCAVCPHNQWGSKISPSGAKIKACADVRRLAILPAADQEYSPILLRIPGGSLSDLGAYGKALKQRGIPYAAVVTKLSFDPDASFPKVLFQFERVLTPAEMQHVVGRMSEPVINDILGLNVAMPALAAPAADDKFGIPADVVAPVDNSAAIAKAAADAAVAKAAAEKAEMEASVAAVEAKAPAKRKAKGFGSAPAEEPAAEPAAATPAAASATTGAPGDMLGSIEDALAALNF